jgi:hypothetical protein
MLYLWFGAKKGERQLAASPSREHKFELLHTE